MKKGLLIATIFAAAISAGATGMKAEAAEVFKFNGGMGILINGSCITGPELPKPELPEEPKPEEPKPEEPKPEEPKPEEPKPEPPKPEEPKPEEPKPEEPKPEQPKPEPPKPELPDEDETEKSLEQQVANLVNAERIKAGLAPLEFKTDIAQAAAVRAKEIKTKFSHTRPNGTSFSTALKEQGVSYRGVGENIAWGQKSPEQVMEAWMNSSGHRANILNEKYTSIGVGYYQDSSGTPYWTQLFTY